MSKTRDFDAMLAEKMGERPTFTVAGQTFTLRSKLPYAKWNKLLAGMRSEDTDAHQVTVEFFNTVLIKADRPRFAELLNDDGDDDEDESGVLDMSQMDAITDWVMEHYTGKLQSSSPGSSPGASATGQPRNVVSLNARTSAG
jgi:hypothetical protein